MFAVIHLENDSLLARERTLLQRAQVFGHRISVRLPHAVTSAEEGLSMPAAGTGKRVLLRMLVRMAAHAAHGALETRHHAVEAERFGRSNRTRVLSTTPLLHEADIERAQNKRRNTDAATQEGDKAFGAAHVLGTEPFALIRAPAVDATERLGQVAVG